MVPDHTIRRATTDDISAIQRIARKSWRGAYGDFIDDEDIEAMLAEGYSEAFLENAITSTAMTLFVAEDGLSVVGFVSCEPPADGSVGGVSIYVSPDYWGEGLGSALLERAQEYLAAKGATEMQDTVLDANDVGNAFYGKHFDPVEETTVEMGDDEFEATVYRGELA